ncbi:hypothetical protein [Halohasta litorea]|uniref:Uncharacterized protein n=1 Tax=Halohasta litorea TaxID=869891 RepID=A0ABD6D7N4_9EURY|nr:hypothetical protein [Halohasta litorea]
MTTQDDVTLAAMIRSVPIHCLLLTLVPAVLAAVQLANSYINDVSLFVSVPFALVMVLFAVVLTQHQFARFRRQQVERTLQCPTAE